MVTPQVDDLTKCMYPPIQPDQIYATATALVSSIEHFVHVTRLNCDSSRLPWLDQATQEVVDNYETLSESLDQFKATEAAEDAEA